MPRLKQQLDAGEPLPEYFKAHPVYYAGPAKKPANLPSGSFGPTTAGRMDSYVELFQRHGGSLVMIAKGNRGPQVTAACQKYGGFYLGSIGGPAAILAKENIRKVEVLEFEELGMEAIWKIDVVDFPAFILVDDKGNDFFQNVGPGCDTELSFSVARSVARSVADRAPAGVPSTEVFSTERLLARGTNPPGPGGPRFLLCYNRLRRQPQPHRAEQAGRTGIVARLQVILEDVGHIHAQRVLARFDMAGQVETIRREPARLPTW